MSRIAARPRRADASRNATAIVTAAVAVLARGGEFTMAAVAAESGTTRQTVYAHFPGREALLEAAVERQTRVAAEVLGGVRPRTGPAADALARWLDTSWALIERFPALRHPALAETGTSPDVHAPMLEDLALILRRARRQGVLNPGVTTYWATVIVVALGHAAADEVAGGRMSAGTAGASYKQSVRRLCLAVGPGS